MDGRTADWAPIEHSRVTHGRCRAHIEHVPDTSMVECAGCNKFVNVDSLIVEDCPGAGRVIK